MEEDGMRLCLVCTAKSDSAHFGVDSCRACAAFFRRTVSLGKRYICRQGTQNCEVNKDVRYICRRCRYIKCLSIGMHPDNVHSKQGKKSSSEDRSNDGDNGEHSAGPSSHSQLLLPSDIEIKQEPSAFKQLSPSVISIGSSEEMPMLNRIQEQYRMTCCVRQNAEHAAILNVNAMNGVGAFLWHRQEDQNRPRPATWGSLNQCTSSAIDSMSEFASNCFDCFAEMEGEERWALIQHYITSMFIFEGSYRTKKLFPGNDDVFMISYITYIDLNDVDSFFADATGVEDKPRAAQLLRDNIKNSLVDWMGTILERADLTETECIALYGLLMFPPYLAKGTPRIAKFTHEIHQTIHRELNIFYKEKMRLEDTSARFAHLTAIQLCVQGIVYKIKEDMEIYRLLNIFDENSYVYTVVQRDYTPHKY